MAASSVIEIVSPQHQLDTLRSGLDFCLELHIHMRDVQLDVSAGFSHYLDEEVYIGSLRPDLENSENFSVVFHDFSLADIMDERIHVNSTSTWLMLTFRFSVLPSSVPRNPLLQFEYITLSEQNCSYQSKRCRYIVQ